MKRSIVYIILFIFLARMSTTAMAQTPPHVEIVMRQETAGQNDLIHADVYVHSDDPIIAADIGIELTGECLRIEGRETGGYLPTTPEENGFVPYDETTHSSTRLAASVLGQDIFADPGQFFFRVIVRVLCDAGEAEVRISFAQLVKDDLESYKLSEGQIMTTSGTVRMGPGQPVATAAPLPTRTATAPVGAESVQPNPQVETVDNTVSSWILFVSLVLFILVLLVLIVVLRGQFLNLL